MSKIHLSKKNLLAILAGLVVTILIGYVISLLSTLIFVHLMTNFGLNYRSAFSQQPYLTYNWILRIMSFSSLTIGGFVVGRIVKNKGWIYGGLLGVALIAISVFMAILMYTLPESLMYGRHVLPPGYKIGILLKTLTGLLLHSPIPIGLTTLGGYLSDLVYKKNQKKLNP